MGKIITATIDTGSQYDLLDLYKKVEVVIDLLPKEFETHVNETALKAKIPVAH